MVSFPAAVAFCVMAGLASGSIQNGCQPSPVAAPALARETQAPPPSAPSPPGPWPAMSCKQLAASVGATVACPYEPSPTRDLATPFERGGDCRSAGELRLASGKVAAGDPLTTMAQAPAFTRRVPPGRYPVILRRAAGRNAFALLLLGKTRPVRWEEALLPGEVPGQYYGYPVDAGTGGYADDVTNKKTDALMLAAFEPGSDLVKTNAFVAWLRHVADTGQYDDPANVCVDATTGDNLVSFSSGFGDGSYDVWWGLDASGVPVALVTDFQVLEEDLRPRLGGSDGAHRHGD